MLLFQNCALCIVLIVIVGIYFLVLFHASLLGNPCGSKCLFFFLIRRINYCYKYCGYDNLNHHQSFNNINIFKYLYRYRGTCMNVPEKKNYCCTGTAVLAFMIFFCSKCLTKSVLLRIKSIEREEIQIIEHFECCHIDSSTHLLLTLIFLDIIHNKKPDTHTHNDHNTLPSVTFPSLSSSPQTYPSQEPTTVPPVASIQSTCSGARQARQPAAPGQTLALQQRDFEHQFPTISYFTQTWPEAAPVFFLFIKAKPTKAERGRRLRIYFSSFCCLPPLFAHYE